MDKEFIKKHYEKACLHHELVSGAVAEKIKDGKVTAENLPVYAEILNDTLSTKTYYEKALAEKEREEQKQ